jgi:hypothetical protein
MTVQRQEHTTIAPVTAETGQAPKALPPSLALQRRLTLAGILTILGLLVEVITLSWAHPLAFLTFTFVGATLVAAGIAIYLLSIVNAG